MATIVLRNGWNEAEEYSNVTSVTFLNPEGEEVTFYENGSGGGGSGGGGGTGGVGVQADWLQISPYHPSYINNRPFYIYYDVIVEPDAKEFYVDKQHNLCVTELQLKEPILENQRYIVYWKDCGYLCEVQKIDGDLILGDSSLIKNEAQKESPEPFVGYFIDGVNKLIIGTKEQTEIALVGLLSDKEKVQTIDKKFLPDDIVGLDEERLAEYLTTKGYSVKQDIEDAISDVEKWAEETFVSEEKLEALLKTIATKAELAAAREAIEATILNYKNEVAKTYATKTELTDSQADWEIEDESSPAAIKHKPFGIYPDIIPITGGLAPTPFEAVEGGYQASLGIALDSKEKYTLLWNDTVIPCELGVATAEGVTLNADGTVFITTLPEEEVKLGLRLTDNIYRLDTKFLKKDEILEGMASQQYVKSQINAIPQSDWNQNSISHKGYIRNRPFYTEDDFLISKARTFTQSPQKADIYNYKLVGGEYREGDTERLYTVVWDGKYYKDCICRNVEYYKENSFDAPHGKIPKIIGNAKIWANNSDYNWCWDTEGTHLPFVVSLTNNQNTSLMNQLNIEPGCIASRYSGTHTIQIYAQDNVHKIDTKYLPDTVVAMPDWEAAEGSAGHILHKPTIPDAQVQVDWDIDDAEDIRHILHKPIIPPTPVQSDWKETDKEALSYIKNLPHVLRDPGSTSESLDFFVAHEGATYVVKNHEIATDFIVTDWEERNPLSRNYIINKPFGENPYLFDGDLNKISTYYKDTGIGLSTFATIHPMPIPKLGKRYEVIVNDISYKSVAQDLSKVLQTEGFVQLNTGIYFGNAFYLGEENPNTGEKYCVVIALDESTEFKYYQCYLKSPTDPGTINLCIREYDSIKKIDKKYLPDECFNGGANSEQLSALEKLVQAQSELINQMQQQLQDLTQRVGRLEQGYTPPSGPGASVNGENLEVEGSVADEILIIQGGAVSNETLVLSGENGTQAKVEGEELTINGSIANEALNLGSGAVIGEVLELAESTNTVIEETVSTTGTINDDILTSSGVATASEIWEVK